MENVETCVEEFIEVATKRGKAQLEGNSRVVNKQMTRLRQLYPLLRQYCLTGGTNNVLRLLEHENKYVRLHAAFCLIPVAPEQSRQTYIALSTEPGLLGFEAEMTLKEWDKGNLKV